MDVTLQFVTSSDPISRLIRWFTWSEFSHVDIVLDSGFLLGAHFEDGVQVRHPYYAVWEKKERRIVRNVPVGFLDWAQGQIGKPYDWSAIFGLVWRSDDWRHPGRWFCSELIAAAFEAAKRPVVLGDSWRISPRDLMLSPLLEKLP